MSLQPRKGHSLGLVLLLLLAALGMPSPVRADVHVIATLPTGDAPQAPVMAPDGRSVYVVNSGSGTLTVIDTGTNRVRATITLGGTPYGAAVSPDSQQVYVANLGSNSVAVIDANDQVADTITGLSGPTGVAFSQDGTKAYVSEGGSPGGISVIDTAQRTVVRTINIGPGLFSMTVSPDERYALGELLSFGTGFALVDLQTGDSVALPILNNEPGVGDIVFVGTDTALMIGGHHLYSVNLATGTTVPIVVGANPTDVEISPNQKLVVVANHDVDTLTLIDAATQEVLGQLPAVGGPHNIAFTPDGSQLLVTLDQSNQLGVLSAANPRMSLVTVGTQPWGLVVQALGPTAYVLNNGAATVSVVDAPLDPFPGAPTSVMAVPGSGSAQVSWVPPSYPGTSPITSYTVRVAGQGSTDSSTGCTSSAAQCTVTGLRNGTPYTFTVTGSNASGEGPASAASPAVTLQPDPPRAQTLLPCSSLPKKIKHRGVTRILGARCRTNAGERVHVLVSASSLGSQRMVRLRLLRGHRGMVRLKTYGDRMIVDVTLRAKAVSGFSVYQQTRTYRVTRHRPRR